MVLVDTKARNAEAFQSVLDHDRVERHDCYSKAGGRFLETIVEINRRLCSGQVQSWEELEGLGNDVLDLGAVGVHTWVVPKFPHPSVDCDDVVVAGDNIQRYNLVVPALDEDGMREHRNPVGTNVVIGGGQADNIKPASTKSGGLSLAVALPWGDDWAPRGRGSVVGGQWMVAWWCGRLGRVLGGF
jgi:hypothetical protein